MRTAWSLRVHDMSVRMHTLRFPSDNTRSLPSDQHPLHEIPGLRRTLKRRHL